MKDRIMMAAVEEMNERGIKFTMTDLAKRIGVSKRCLYEHFASKEDLISAIMDIWLENILEKRKEILADESLSFEKKLQRIIFVKPMKFMPAEGRIGAEIKKFMPLEWERIQRFMSGHWKIIESFLQSGIENGYIRDVYLPVVEKIIRGSINEIIDYHFLVGNNISLEQSKAQVVDILIYGLIDRVNLD